jgi:acetyl esterase/lipase
MAKAASAARTAKAGRHLLFGGALNALNTLNAVKPFSRNGVSALPSFAAGLFPSDQPVQAFALEAATAAPHLVRGGLRTRTGKVGMALHLASTAGLFELYRSAQGDRDRLEEALLEALGADYHERLGNVGSAPDLPLTGRQLALPSFGKRGLRARRDVSYGEFGRRNTLDVYHRADLDPAGGAPVLLQVHGGAWAFGNKNGQGRPLMAHLAERGWVCVAVNYRLAPRNPWPAQIVDVKRAIAWIRHNITQDGGDNGFIAVTGGSAGGHLASLAALTPNEPAFQPGFEDADTSIQAAVPYYGQYDFVNENGLTKLETIRHLEQRVFKHTSAADPAAFRAASPLHHVSEDAPPFFVIHGANDSVLPVEQARNFADTLRQVSKNPVAYAELPRAQHAFDYLTSVRNHHTIHAAERFLLWSSTLTRSLG